MACDMRVCPDIWNVLHDATLIAAAGSIPGTVALTLECDYLRKRFPVRGEHFVLILEGCSRFQFRPWDEQLPVVSNLAAIAAERLWILSADQRDEHCQIHCQLTGKRSGGGSLEIAAQSATLRLDSGATIEMAEIASVAESYWREWSTRGPIVQAAKGIAKDILAGGTTPYEGAKAIVKLHLDLVPGDHCLDGFVSWEDEYEDAADEERRSYCERAILKVARDLLDGRYPGGPNWDENAPSVWV